MDLGAGYETGGAVMTTTKDKLAEALKIQIDLSERRKDFGEFYLMGKSALAAYEAEKCSLSEDVREAIRYLTENKDRGDLVDKHIETLIRAAQRPEVEVVMWQPIETAPMDGTRILLWNDAWSQPQAGHPMCGGWAAYWSSEGSGHFKYQPTHWMPLPDPPNGIRIVKEKA